jgi:excisionase family DNA binding protein
MSVMTPQDVASRIKMTPAYVRLLCERGELRARKCGKFWRIEEADFLAWWSAGKTSANLVHISSARR